MCRRLLAVYVVIALQTLSTRSSAVERNVSTTAQFAAALSAASAGDEIVLQPGVYSGGHYRVNLQQVVIRSANPANPAIFDGGSNGIQLSDAHDVTIADLVFRNQSGNGLNIDDGGTYDTPAQRITLRNLTVQDIVTPGNFDGIKLSGVDDFLVENVTVRNWGTGGSAIDMVGCHRGLVQNSNFVHTNTANGGTTLQPKGGSKDITFRANRIELPRGSGRAVQAGGSTGTPFFRFVPGDSGYEANDIVAEGNVIIGGSSAFSWVNIDGGVFHHNAVHRPGQQWVARILNENQGLPIVDTQNGQFHDNRIVYNDTGTEFSTAVNVGPETLPTTYSFARNRWLNLANPTSAGSTPSLPVAEVGGTYGVDPGTPIDAAHIWDFAWGKWIVNANATQKAVTIAGYQSLRQAVPGNSALFEPLAADPLAGAWNSAALGAATIQLPAFSQVILVDPAACPNCVSVAGDYDQNGLVNSQDYAIWRAAFGSAVVGPDGNGNGVVDAADYVIWRSAAASATGSLAGIAAVSILVPESAALPLSAVGFVIATWPRRSSLK